MKSSKIKKILAGVQTAVLVTGVTMLTSCCNKDQCKKDSGGSCGSKMKMEQKDPNAPKGSCGKGSCSKGSCSK